MSLHANGHEGDNELFTAHQLTLDRVLVPSRRIIKETVPARITGTLDTPMRSMTLSCRGPRSGSELKKADAPW